MLLVLLLVERQGATLVRGCSAAAHAAQQGHPRSQCANARAARDAGLMWSTSGGRGARLASWARRGVQSAPTHACQVTARLALRDQ